ncbi:MAG TPA: hypothetical protein DEX10_09990, partial [Betaproteobacteria bacterium]|nr:hypothetical protein [Betaproteobacteria bacterium]
MLDFAKLLTKKNAIVDGYFEADLPQDARLCSPEHLGELLETVANGRAILCLTDHSIAGRVCQISTRGRCVFINCDG